MSKQDHDYQFGVVMGEINKNMEYIQSSLNDLNIHVKKNSETLIKHNDKIIKMEGNQENLKLNDEKQNKKLEVIDTHIMRQDKKTIIFDAKRGVVLGILTVLVIPMMMAIFNNLISNWF